MPSNVLWYVGTMYFVRSVIMGDDIFNNNS